EHEGRVEVVDVREDELEVVLLAGLAEVLDALRLEERVRGSVVPPLHERLRVAARRVEAPLEEAVSDPRAAELILFAELAAGAGSEHGDRLAGGDEAIDLRGPVAQARRVHAQRPTRFPEEPRARGGKQDHGPVEVVAPRELGRAVVQVEAVRDAAAELADEERALEPSRERDSDLERRDGEAAAAAVDRRDRSRRRPDHVDRDDRVPLPVVAGALGEAVDDDRRHRENLAEAPERRDYAGKMLLSVLIPTLRRPELLRETLESVLAADPLPDEVIVIDGEAGGSTAAVLAELQPASGMPALKVISSRPSVTHQRNEGIDAAEGDVLVFLDDDVAVDPKLFAT